MAICTCSYSGNTEIKDLEEPISEIGKLVRSSTDDSNITSDSNTKSSLWCMNVTVRKEVRIGNNVQIVVNRGDI